MAEFAEFRPEIQDKARAFAGLRDGVPGPGLSMSKERSEGTESSEGTEGSETSERSETTESTETTERKETREWGGRVW